MSEHLPLWSQNVVFLSGDMDYLKELESRLLMAISDHVHVFMSDEKKSRFLIIADGSGEKTTQLVRDITYDYFHCTRAPTIAKLKNCDNFLSPEDTIRFFEKTFTWRVYSRDEKTPEEIQNILFEFVSTDPNQTSDGSGYLFDLIGAQKHEAYFVCKLSAIRPFFSICDRVHDGIRDVCILNPFPAYVDLTEKQFNALKELYHALEKHCSETPGVDCGYLSSVEVVTKAGYSKNNPDNTLQKLRSNYLVYRKPIPSDNNHSSFQYRITDDGIFTMFRVSVYHHWDI